MIISGATQWTGPQLWSSQSFSGQNDWIVQLNEQEISEIHIAVNAGIQSNKPINQLTRNDFAFEHLGAKLLTLKGDILNGKGFTLLRGLPALDWSDEELVRAYWGIGTWIGDAVSQNAKAHLLGHVIDQRASQSGNTRIYQTNQAQPFHSDSCDIVGLLCLRVAKNGGESSVASSAAIHNHLLKHNPESLMHLYDVFQCDRYGEIPQGKLPYYPVHIFNSVDEQLVCCGMDPDIRSAQRLDGVQQLTQRQLTALDDFQSAARQHCLRMSLQRGDIQLVNNLIAVHARESFIDHDDIDRRRYLVRLWLSSGDGRRLPEFLRERWGNIDVGTIRGGIKVPGAMPIAHLDPDG
ncbi:MAG: TauD/TfdA family dioxygenase [Granulosicoccus sp.]